MIQKIKCLAVDDEPLALDLLEDNIKKISFLELCGKFNIVNEAIQFLSVNEVDLIFLDIRMPEVDGITFLKTFIHKPMVIFVTAYDNYAIDGFDLDVIDYVLKPVSFQRFYKAATKAYNIFQQFGEKQEKAVVSPIQENAYNQFIFVKSEHKIIKIKTDEIKYIESLKDYVKIYVSEKPILALLSLKYLEENLPPNIFIRVHRSFIVSLLHVNYIAKSNIYIGTKPIPLSGAYKDQFMKMFLDKNR